VAAQRTDRPFLCYLAPPAPHRSVVPPDVVWGRSGLGDRADGVCLVDWMGAGWLPPSTNMVSATIRW
jgi:hypothetical protein